jgi:hypothetical protein
MLILKKGVVPGVFLNYNSNTKCDDNERKIEIFYSWAELLFNLLPNCLIVLDNEPYNSVQIGTSNSGIEKGRFSGTVSKE